MSFGRSLAIALFSLAAFAPLLAQNYTNISGVIQDPSAASVPGAIVTVVNEDTGVRREAMTQADGAYIVSPLQPGVYKITVRKAGFRTMIRFGVKLTEALPARVDFKLVVGSFQETITVEGSAPLLNGEDVSIGIVANQNQIQNLPVDGRGLLSLVELAPGVVVTPATRGEAGQFTVNGQRPNTHYFAVDGASANSGVSGGGVPAQSTGGTLPGMTAFGSLDSLVSLDALQEMRVQTSTTASEFGRMPGAQVSLSSRSGSNELHGSLLYGFRNEAMDANDWFANRHGDPRAPLHQQDFAATLGGPLWRDHTFFFLSYAGLRLRQPFVWNQPVPALDLRNNALPWAGPLLQLFPEPNGPALGTNTGLAEWTAGISRPSRLDTGAVRLDHTFGSRLTAFARYSESPSSTEFGSEPINTLDLRSRGLTLGFTFRAKPNFILDLRANGSSASANSIWQPADPGNMPSCFLEPVTSFFLLTPGICDYLVRLTIAGVGQVVSGSEGRREQTQLQIAPTASWNRGAHAVRIGADYRRLAPKRSDATGSLAILADTAADLRNSSNFWEASSPQQLVSAVVTEISLFAQDTWRATPRLTLSYGLRWEISPAPTESRQANFFDPQGAPVAPQQSLWSSTYANFAPRAGIAYQFGRDGRTVMRGGFGLYYDSSLNLVTDLVNDGPLNISNFRRNTLLAQYLNYGYLSNLKLPLVKQWNISIEHAFGLNDVLSAGYVGSSGSDLIRRELSGSASLLALTTNNGSSDYHALEVQYRRRMVRGLEAQISYAYSHSLDNSSTDAGLYWSGPGLIPAQDRASSDFDIRHSLTAGFTYAMPRGSRERWWRGWALDGMFRARTGFPINVLEAEQFEGIVLENAFRPDLLPGRALWITDNSAPGGRRINREAFQAAPFEVQGNFGRNVLSGLGMSQLDLAARREFSFAEQRSLEFRVEAFNTFNRANFADPVRFLASPLFGQSTSMLNLMLGTGSPGSGLAPVFQAGGPRSLRVVVRFRF